jgi:hypothetical protein
VKTPNVLDVKVKSEKEHCKEQRVKNKKGVIRE